MRANSPSVASPSSIIFFPATRKRWSGFSSTGTAVPLVPQTRLSRRAISMSAAAPMSAGFGRYFATRRTEAPVSVKTTMCSTGASSASSRAARAMASAMTSVASD